jgi:peptide/nickel transport system substrate-binding protein
LPRLAERWQWENEGTRLRVTLRRNVRFHDGTPLAAPLIAKVLTETVGRPSSQAPYTSLAFITGIRADGDRELVVDLSQRSSFLPEDLELPLNLASQEGEPAIGAGAFHITKISNNEAELQGFDQYYAGAPKISTVNLRSFDTMRAAWTNLLRGEIDMVTNVPPDAIEFVSNDDVQVISFARRFQFLVGFNARKRPLSSPAVRRALNYAIDREALIKNVLQSKASPSTGPIWPQHWAYDATVQPYSFNPTLAASLLDASGLRSDKRPDGPPSRFRFTCLIPANYTVIERVALEIQKQLYNLGVDMQFEALSPGDFNKRVREGRFEAMLIDMISGPAISKAHMFWRSAQRFKGFNFFGYENPAAERLFDMLIESTNEVAVRSATSGLQRVFLEDPPALFLAWTESSRAIRRQFRVIAEPGRDPLYTIWRWTVNSADPRRSTE